MALTTLVAPAVTVAAASAPAARPAPATAGVAFVTDLKGEHSLDGKRLTLMTEVGDGQALRVAADGMVVLMFIQSGHEYSLTPGEYKVADGAVKVVPGKNGASGKATRRITPWRPDAGGMVNVARSATASLRMRSLPTPAAAPGASDKARALEPVDTIVTTLQPTLTFQAPNGKVKLRLESEGRTVADIETEARQWVVNRKLEPGRSYRWLVGTGGGESVGSFKVADAETLKRLTSMPSPRTFSDRVLRATTLQSVGATAEARAAFAALAAERPDLPELANLAR